jgi:hypothetical protein
MRARAAAFGVIALGHVLLIWAARPDERLPVVREQASVRVILVRPERPRPALAPAAPDAQPSLPQLTRPTSLPLPRASPTPPPPGVPVLALPPAPTPATPSVDAAVRNALRRLAGGCETLSRDLRADCEARVAGRLKASAPTGSARDDAFSDELRVEGERLLRRRDAMDRAMTLNSNARPGDCHGSNFGAGCMDGAIISLTKPK